MDFNAKEIAKELTIQVIEKGLHCVNPDHYEDPEAIGERYRDYLRDKRNDRRWTRGLAIAAIIISIAALCVSALSLWLQWKSQ